MGGRPGQSERRLPRAMISADICDKLLVFPGPREALRSEAWQSHLHGGPRRVVPGRPVRFLAGARQPPGQQ